MKIKITKSGISFASLVKLISVGYFIGTAILLPLMFAVFSYSEWHQPIPTSLLFMLPVLIVLQALLTALIVAVGIKLYGKVSRFEISSEEKL